MFSTTRPLGLICLTTCLVTLVLLGASCAFGADTPRLDGAKCLPTTGDTNTLFSFTILYYGAVAPSSANLYVDSTVLSMKNAGAGPMGSLFYVCQTKLTAGAHKYRFVFGVDQQTLRKPGPTDSETYTSPTVAKAPAYSLSGRVLVNGTGFARIEVRLSKTGTATQTLWTNSEGRFTAPALAPGIWTVTTVKYGYTMNPTYRKVTLPPSTTTCDFTASRP